MEASPVAIWPYIVPYQDGLQAYMYPTRTASQVPRTQDGLQVPRTQDSLMYPGPRTASCTQDSLMYPGQPPGTQDSLLAGLQVPRTASWQASW